ncbi:MULTISPECIES: hypothetical protein [unclassified Ruegeria]|uniref:hypothetical protein n=1 Tax=unclassified Ruegeria TaxID=2625375 RepID=UPI001AE7BEFC|nr:MULTISPECIES: hypothetical protein [unclassified Ruegeria]
MTGGGTAPDVLADRIVDAVEALPAARHRQLVAIAGPPGSGKSTVASLATAKLNRRGVSAGLVPMDGFHFDNAILKERGLFPRKGAPETFDLVGFHALLVRLRAEDEVAIPGFDRKLDLAIAARSMILPDQRVVLVEGNYLLLDEAGWSGLHALWALKVFLGVDLATLKSRLTDRWVGFGLDKQAARERALSNDIPNAERVIQNSVQGDLNL